MTTTNPLKKERDSVSFITDDIHKYAEKNVNCPIHLYAAKTECECINNVSEETTSVVSVRLEPEYRDCKSRYGIATQRVLLIVEERSDTTMELNSFCCSVCDRPGYTTT